MFYAMSLTTLDNPKGNVIKTFKSLKSARKWLDAKCLSEGMTHKPTSCLNGGYWADKEGNCYEVNDKPEYPLN